MESFFSTASPEVKAALISALIAIIFSFVSTTLSIVNSWHILKRRSNTKKLLKIFLNRFDEKFVPFYIIRHHIGGLTDAEIRQSLVELGAIRLSDGNEVEFWVDFSRLTRNERLNVWNLKLTDVRWPPITDYAFGNLSNV